MRAFLITIASLLSVLLATATFTAAQARGGHGGMGGMGGMGKSSAGSMSHGSGMRLGRDGDRGRGFRRRGFYGYDYAAVVVEPSCWVFRRGLRIWVCE